MLRSGATVFGVSAAFLLVAPEFFIDLLGLEPSPDMSWAMRMIAVTLIALTGNMAVVSLSAAPTGVVASAIVMMVCAGGLGFVTLLIPAQITWFSTIYALIGFGFSAAYLVGLAWWLRPGH